MEIKRIEVSLVRPDPNNPRKSFPEERLKQLAESIRSVGLVEPLVVRPLSDGSFMVVAGEMRFRAISTYLEWEQIECRVVHVDEREARRMGFAENVEREELDPVELGAAWLQYRKEHGISQRALAGELGGKASYSTICRYESLTRLSPRSLQQIKSGVLPVSVGFHLARIEDCARQDQVVDAIRKHGMTAQKMAAAIVSKVEDCPHDSVDDIVRQVTRKSPKRKEAREREGTGYAGRLRGDAENRHRLPATGRAVKVQTQGGHALLKGSLLGVRQAMDVILKAIGAKRITEARASATKYPSGEEGLEGAKSSPVRTVYIKTMKLLQQLRQIIGSALTMPGKG